MWKLATLESFIEAEVMEVETSKRQIHEKMECGRR